ncbi:MAG: hypothetical protein LAN71_08995 [Acidobacteriia bacterium]|nr:hypothetical protein [Terriglobia bacterium]
MKIRRVLAVMAVMVLTSTAVSAQLFRSTKIPKVLQARFVSGDPVWRELPVRADFQKNYDKIWQTAVNTILEHNFDIATMDKDSGYFRTLPNAKIVSVGTNWVYKVQISIKLVSTPGDPKATPPVPTTVDKVRLQVSGEVTNVDVRGVVRANYLGYDQVLLDSLFQDLQAKLGGA